MNRFKIVLGKEKAFEDVWKNRETHLENVPGFKKFNLIKGEKKEDHTLYASHSIWNSKEDFVNWTCLLYTSPSPRDGLLSRMPSSA